MDERLDLVAANKARFHDRSCVRMTADDVIRWCETADFKLPAKGGLDAVNARPSAKWDSQR